MVAADEGLVDLPTKERFCGIGHTPENPEIPTKCCEQHGSHPGNAEERGEIFATARASAFGKRHSQKSEQGNQQTRRPLAQKAEAKEKAKQDAAELISLPPNDVETQFAGSAYKEQQQRIRLSATKIA